MNSKPEQDGPLARLSRALGKDAEFAPIAAVKRIDVMPRRLNIYECRKCGYRFPHEASCPECGSTDMCLFMRAPSPSEIRPLRNHEEWLTEHDPDWRERFGGDADRALDFYCPEITP